MRKPDATIVSEYEMRFPSGGVVMIDAGTLLAADPEALRTLQKRLKQAAFERTANGHPFRAGVHATPMGSVLVAPVRHRKTPHPVEVVRKEDGAPIRLVADLAGSGPPDVPAVLPPATPDAPSHADGPSVPRPDGSDLSVAPPTPDSTDPGEPGEGISTLPSSRARRPMRAAVALIAAVTLALVLAACGDESAPDEGGPASDAAPAEIPTDLPPPTVTSPPEPPTVLPDHWYALADRAKDASLRSEVRVDAIREMGQAGPNAHLVLPALNDLAESTEPAIRVAAEEALAVLEETLPDRS